MPAKKKYYKRKYKKYKKAKKDISTGGDKEVIKTGQIGKQSVVYRGIGLPAEFYTKLKYNVNLTFNTFPYEEILFRMGSIFDPEFAFGGDKPMYTDQFFTLYRKFNVNACDIKMSFINKSATGETSYQRVGCYPLGQTAFATGIQEAVERDNGVYSTLGPNTGDQGIVNMSLYGKIHKLLGLPKDEAQDDSLSGTTSSNPTVGAYAHIYCGSLDGLTTSNVYCTVTLTYYVRFYDRIPVVRS